MKTEDTEVLGRELNETEAKAPRFEAEAVKIAPRGCLEAR